jgi:AhpD family alkylhydroperoxidase
MRERTVSSRRQKGASSSTMKQTDPEKLKRSLAIIEELKAARGGSVMTSHRTMGNDPNLVNMFLQQYVNCNKKDIEIPRKYRELIVMAIGMATGTETTMKVHADLALKNGATIDEVFEVIRILFFTCGVTKLLPALETLGDLFEPVTDEDAPVTE